MAINSYVIKQNLMTYKIFLIYEIKRQLKLLDADYILKTHKC